jgi:hypothetical protein
MNLEAKPNEANGRNTDTTRAMIVLAALCILVQAQIIECV